MTSKYKKKHKCPAPDQCPLGVKEEGFPCLFAGQQKNTQTGQIVGSCALADVVYGIQDQMQMAARAAAGIVLAGPGFPPGGKPS